MFLASPSSPAITRSGKTAGPVCAGQSLTGLPSYVRRGDTPRITLDAAVPGSHSPGHVVSLDQADRADLYKKYDLLH